MWLGWSVNWSGRDSPITSPILPFTNSSEMFRTSMTCAWSLNFRWAGAGNMSPSIVPQSAAWKWTSVSWRRCCSLAELKTAASFLLEHLLTNDSGMLSTKDVGTHSLVGSIPGGGVKLRVSPCSIVRDA
jgi:hypothetical protein